MPTDRSLAEAKVLEELLYVCCGDERHCRICAWLNGVHSAECTVPMILWAFDAARAEFVCQLLGHEGQPAVCYECARQHVAKARVEEWEMILPSLRHIFNRNHPHRPASCDGCRTVAEILDTAALRARGTA